MFGKIIGAVAGSKLAESTRGIGGPGGALLGIGAATIAKRLSLPALIAVSAGGYFVKKRLDKKRAAEPTPKAPPKVKSSAM
jgi:hypothetical protein